MKKIFIIFAMFCATVSMGQSTDTTNTITLATVHTDSTILDYRKLSKIKLTEIYLQEVIKITNGLSTCAFDTIGNSVPTTKYTQGKFRRTKSKMDTYNETLLKEYREIIPYSDKDDLIRAIIYLKNL